MPKIVFSRNDVEALSSRMEDRSWSPMFMDMPELRRDMRSAASLLKFMTAHGMPTSPITVEIVNGFEGL